MLFFIVMAHVSVFLTVALVMPVWIRNYSLSIWLIVNCVNSHLLGILKWVNYLVAVNVAGVSQHILSFWLLKYNNHYHDYKTDKDTHEEHLKLPCKLCWVIYGEVFPSNVGRLWWSFYYQLLVKDFNLVLFLIFASEQFEEIEFSIGRKFIQASFIGFLGFESYESVNWSFILFLVIQYFLIQFLF